MKYIINYGTGAAAFPTKVLEVVSRAGAIDLRVFLALCASSGKAEVKKLAKTVGCSEDEVRDALSFWRGAGIVELCDNVAEQTSTDEPSVEEVIEEKPATAQKTQAETPPKKLQAAAELPKYTSDELANILEERQETVNLINECQNIMGKVFNIREINVIMGFVDYLGLDFEYILMLLTYCVSEGKKSLHYAEKTAFALYDAGITTGAQLTEELRRRENSHAVEGKIRAMFGIGDRAFTTKEKKFVSAWVNDMNYSIEIIEKAYELTADATGKGSFPYANTIIERWNAEGLRTLDEIEKHYADKEKGNKPQSGSFDTDSFFEAAVRRSLGEIKND